MKISRRQFATIGATAIGAASGLLGTKASAMPNPPTFIARKHGPVITGVSGESLTNNESENSLRAYINRGHHDLLKVVTGWGVYDGGGWNETHMTAVSSMTDYLIVRTHTGDGYDNPLNHQVALNELRPWYNLMYSRGKVGSLIFEIGNEPNIGFHEWKSATSPSDLAPWQYQFDWIDEFGRTVRGIRAEFPGVKICAPAAAPIVGDSKGLPLEYWYTCPAGPTFYRDYVLSCDFVGVHFYGGAYFGDQDPRVFYSTPRAACDVVIGKTAERDRQIPLIVTEYALGSNSDPVDAGRRYASLIHDSNELPSAVWGATYFHIKNDPFDPDVENSGPDAFSYIFPNGAAAYYERITELMLGGNQPA